MLPKSKILKEIFQEFIDLEMTRCSFFRDYNPESLSDLSEKRFLAGFGQFHAGFALDNKVCELIKFDPHSLEECDYSQANANDDLFAKCMRCVDDIRLVGEMAIAEEIIQEMSAA